MNTAFLTPRTLIVLLVAFATLSTVPAYAQVVNALCEETVTKQITDRVTKAKYNTAVIQNTPAAVAVLAKDICADEDGAFVEGSVSDLQLLGMLLEAQTRVSEGESATLGEYGGTARIVSCFNYYGFGSVIPHLSTAINTVVSGTTLHVSGSIENLNAYPIVDGTLYVKVFRKRGADGEKDINGPDVVDQFVAADSITIEGKGSTEVSFTWDVPTYIQAGEYELATFFTTSKRYNLMGLSFTDDVVGTTVPFTVEGVRTTGVGFEKDSVQLNGKRYSFAAYAPHFSKNGEVEVTAVLSNTTNQTARVPISWQLYRWDSQRRENLLVTESEEVSIEAEDTVRVSYTITDSTQPVYLLVVKAEYGDTHSILNIRFVRDGIEGARINFPSLANFPLVAGGETTLFSCMHSMNAPVTEANELVLTLFDKEGNEIHSTNYVGHITGAVMGIANTFVPRRNYDYVELVAQLFTDGILVEDARLVYDCEGINSDACAHDEQGSERAYGVYGAAGAGILLLLLIAFGVYTRIYTRPKTEDERKGR